MVRSPSWQFGLPGNSGYSGVMSKAPPPSFVRTRWWWVRHAPVRGDNGRIYGGSDIACDCGDAHVFAGLAPVLPLGAAWVSSHLGRTRQTAEALWQARDFTVDGIAPALTVLPALAEQDLGDWQGRERARFFAERQPLADSYWFAPADERPPNGESFSELCGRVHAAIAELTAEHRGRDIVAVAHGGTIRAAIALALALPPQGGLAFAVENCSLTRLDHYEGPDGAGWRVGMVNSQPWLGASLEGGGPAA
ncbi:Phosphoglycerate mutase [Methylobacterium sp. 4-46]|uniref:histidine phosphatase family protein n=1 Tax=unclassified Methylobacterium TaxID=2615210 RepID=UPI000152D307|nr:MULTISPECIES: histidine phosphatase family protein [Methylobacterium]ACA18034.1 Phosphoglycerate mutase [Methylobacterium sp. 4-46]WFT77336.1 histidine phosphatase family protein [Methylobacterium nodulans]